VSGLEILQVRRADWNWSQGDAEGQTTRDLWALPGEVILLFCPPNHLKTEVERILFSTCILFDFQYLIGLNASFIADISALLQTA
jgi:hypothetical protein